MHSVMKTFISRFLELSEISDCQNEKWEWTPVGSTKAPLFIASTTCCGCTRTYGGGTDVGADDND